MINKKFAMKKLTDAYEEIIETIHQYRGLNWRTDPNFDDTPARCARAILNERTIGMDYEKQCEKLLTVKFPTEYKGFIITNPVTASSLCPHHLENVVYKVIMGYIPTDGAVGLSKIGRVIKLIARAPILQEDYVKRLADIFEKYLNPEGLGVIVKGQHGCMTSRGLSDPGVWVTMSELRGLFRTDPSVKSEFLKLSEI